MEEKNQNIEEKKDLTQEEIEDVQGGGNEIQQEVEVQGGKEVLAIAKEIAKGLM